MLGRVFNLEDFRYPHQDSASEIHIIKLGHTLCQCGVHGNRGSGCPAVIYPVAGFYCSSGSIGRNKFFSIHFLIIHTLHLILILFKMT